MNETMTGRGAARYQSEVLDLLTCGKEQKAALSDDLARMLRVFLEEHEQADYAALCAGFGTPEQLAAELQKDIPVEEARRTRKQRAWLRRGVCAVLAVAAVGGVGTAAYFNWARETNPNTIETVVYEDASAIPELEKIRGENQTKYGLSLKCDESNRIIMAYDEDDHEVPVDQYGKPLDEDYPISPKYAEYLKLLEE